jgi:hypothetical protein
VEPFNWRRLGVLGAGPWLQSYFWPIWTTSAPAVADALIGQLVVFGGAWAAVSWAPGAGRARPVLAASLGLIALLAALTIPVTNSSPTLLPLGAAVVLLVLTTRLAWGKPARAMWALAVMWGFVAAWLVGFRTSNVVFPHLGAVGTLFPRFHAQRGAAVAIARGRLRELRARRRGPTPGVARRHARCGLSALSARRAA